MSKVLLSKYRLSIIIPVYNTGKYLAGCIMSCIDQDIPPEDYEIIIIDDGSQDESPAVIEEFRSAYGNIRVHAQTNSGLSVARNVGMDMALGAYVWFVDSDDRIKENCLRRVLAYADGMDMLALGLSLPRTVMTGGEFMKETRGRFQHGAPYYVFSRSFLTGHSLRFYPGIYHEDSEFTPRALCLAKRVSVLDEECYCRNMREGSITRTVNIRRAYDLLFVIQMLRRFIDDHVTDRRIRRQMMKLLPLLANSSLNVVSASEPVFWERYQRKFMVDKVNDCFLKSGDVRYVFEGLLFAVSGRPVKVYKFLKRNLRL